MALDWWDLAALPTWYTRKKEEPKQTPPDFGASALNSADIAYYLRKGQSQRKPEGPAPNPDPFADLNKWSQQQDEKATWTERRNAPLDPWVQRYQQAQAAKMGPQERPVDYISQAITASPMQGAWLGWRSLLDQTAAGQVLRQRNEEIGAAPLRAIQGEPYEGMTFQATKPQYGNWLGPVALPAWNLTGGQTPDPGAIWRNAERLPGVGPVMEEGARRFEMGANWLGMLQDLNVSKRLPGGLLSVGEYAGALRDTAMQNFQQFGNEWSEDWRTALPDFFNGRQAQTLQNYQQNVQQMRAASPSDLMGEYARINALGGAENVRQTYTDLTSRDPWADNKAALAGELTKLASDPRENPIRRETAAADAARLGKEATELRRMTPAQIVDQRMPIVENIAFSFILDPLEWVGWVGGLAQLTSKANRIRAGAAAVPDQARAVQVFENLVPNAEGVRVAERMGGNASSINPFALTKEAAADIDASTLFTTHMQLLQDVGTKEDARALLMTLMTNPAQLVQGGVSGLVSPRLVAQANEAGQVLFGGFAATREAIQARRVYEQIAPRLLELPALVGEGVLDKMQLIGQLDDLVTEGARAAHGLNPMDLPVGMTKVRKVPTSTGEYAIEYLGPMGTVIRTDGPMQAEQATRRLREIEETPKPNFLKRFAGVQRALMSELYLNLRPAHWIRNGVSAAGHLVTDDVMTLEPTAALWDYITTKTGGVRPTRRLNEAAGGVANMTEAGSKSILPGVLGRASEAGQRIWTGDASIDLGKNLSIPVGEQNFYLRAFTTTMREAFARNWRRDIQRSLATVLDSAGVDPTLRSAITAAVVDAGLQGGRADVAERLRMVTEGQILPFAPEAFGVPADALTPEGWREVRGILQDATPVDVKRMRIDEVFDRDTQRYAGVTNEAPPAPGRYAWTDAEAEDDAANLIDEARKAARRSGQDPEEAARQADELMKRKAQLEQEGIDAVRQAAQNSTDPEALRTMIDVWVDVFELKRQTRTANALAVDDVLSGGSDWGQYFGAAMRNWSSYNDQVAQVFANAVTDLADIAAGRVRQGGRDAWDMIRRFLDYDERAVASARQLQPTSPAYDSETFKAVIDANRKFVDREVARAWAAARRYMDAETLDILMGAERDTQRMGAQVAAYVGNERNRMLGKELQLEEYYSVRNQSWKELAEAQAARWRAAQYEIVKSKKGGSGTVTGVYFVEDANWPGMERQSILTRRVATGPDGVARWEVQDADGGELRIVAETDLPKDAVAEFVKREQALDAQVDAEVQALGQEAQAGYRPAFTPEQAARQGLPAETAAARPGPDVPDDALAVWQRLPRDLRMSISKGQQLRMHMMPGWDAAQYEEMGLDLMTADEFADQYVLRILFDRNQFTDADRQTLATFLRNGGVVQDLTDATTAGRRPLSVSPSSVSTPPFTGPVHPSIDKDKDPEAWNAWVRFANENPDLAQQRVDDYNGRRAQVQQRVSDEYRARQQPRAVEPEVDFGMGAPLPKTGTAAADVPVLGSDPELQDAVDWRLLRGMKPDRVAKELGISATAVDGRRAMLLDEGLLFSSATDAKVFARKKGGSVFKLNPAGRSRLKELDRKFVGSTTAERTGTALGQPPRLTAADVDPRRVEIDGGRWRINPDAPERMTDGPPYEFPDTPTTPERAPSPQPSGPQPTAPADDTQRKAERLRELRAERSQLIAEYGSKGEKHPSGRYIGGINPAAQRLNTVRGQIARIEKELRQASGKPAPLTLLPTGKGYTERSKRIPEGIAFKVQQLDGVLVGKDNLGRFYISVDGELAQADYRKLGDVKKELQDVVDRTRAQRAASPQKTPEITSGGTTGESLTPRVKQTPSTVGTRAAAQFGQGRTEPGRLMPPNWYGERYAQATHVIQPIEGGAVYPVRVLEVGAVQDAGGFTDGWVDQGDPYVVVQFLADELPADQAARSAQVGEQLEDFFRRGDVRSYDFENAPYRLQPLSEAERRRLMGDPGLLADPLESVGQQVRSALARAFRGESVDVSEVAPISPDAVEALLRGPVQWELPPRGLPERDTADWVEMQSTREYWREQLRTATTERDRAGAQERLDDVDAALDELRSKEVLNARSFETVDEGRQATDATAAVQPKQTSAEALAASYKAQGMSINEAWDAFQAERGQRPEINGREFAEIFYRTEAGRVEASPTAAPNQVTVTGDVNLATVNVADLAADYKRRGMDRRRAWDQFIIDRSLKPEIDAAAFMDIYDGVTAKALVQTRTVNFAPTHFDTVTGKRVQITPRQTAGKTAYDVIWEHGMTGGELPGNLPDRYRPLETTAAQVEMPRAQQVEAVTPTRAVERNEMLPDGLSLRDRNDWQDLVERLPYWREQLASATTEAKRASAEGAIDDVYLALDEIRQRAKPPTPNASSAQVDDLYLAEKKGDLTDERILAATNAELKAALRAIGNDFFRGLDNVQKDVVRRFVDGNAYKRDDALDVVRAHRDYWVQRVQRETAADTQRADRLESLYGGQTLDQLRARLADMDRQIESLRSAGAGEFTGQGTRRTGAATSNEAARSLGQEKMALESYMRQKFGEFNRMVGDDVRTPTTPPFTIEPATPAAAAPAFVEGQRVRNKNTGKVFYVRGVTEREGQVTNVFVGIHPTVGDSSYYPASIFEAVAESDVPSNVRRLGVDDTGDALLVVSPDDLDYETAYRAHTGTSFVPEKRAKGRQDEYVSEMESIVERFAKYADTPERREQLKEMLQDYRRQYLSQYGAVLKSRHGLVSTMIAGPSKFPARQMAKKNATADKRLGEFLSWREKAFNKIRSEFDPRFVARRAISSDAADAPAQLAEKIAKAEQVQERMKAANAVLRKKISDEQKIAQLGELGIDRVNATQLLKPDFAGRKGFAQFELTNNNANIKRMKDRLAQIEKLRSDSTFELPFKGGTVVDNVEENRLQIVFDEKPDADMRTKLKRNGFKWAPSQGAWQRQRGTNANFGAQQVLGIRIERPAQAATTAAQAAAGAPSPTMWQAPEIEMPWTLTAEEYAEKAGVRLTNREFAERIQAEGGRLELHYNHVNPSDRWQKGDVLIFTVQETATGPEVLLTNERTGFKFVYRRPVMDIMVMTEEFPHRAAVEAAINADIEVSEAVLREYPDLLKQVQAERTPPTEASQAATVADTAATETPPAAVDAAPMPEPEAPAIPRGTAEQVQAARNLLPWEMLKSNARKGWDGRITVQGDLISDGYAMVRRDQVVKQQHLEKLDVPNASRNPTATQDGSAKIWEPAIQNATVPARIVGFRDADKGANYSDRLLWIVTDDGLVASVSADRAKYLHFLTGFDEVRVNPSTAEIQGGGRLANRPIVFYADGQPVAMLMPVWGSRSSSYIPDVATMIERAMPLDALPKRTMQRPKVVDYPGVSFEAVDTPPSRTPETPIPAQEAVTVDGKRRAYTGAPDDFKVKTGATIMWAEDFDAAVNWEVVKSGKSDGPATVRVYYVDERRQKRYITGLKNKQQAEKLAKSLLTYATVIGDDGKVYFDDQLMYRYTGRVGRLEETYKSPVTGKDVTGFPNPEAAPANYAGEPVRMDAPTDAENYVRKGLRPMTANQTGLTKAQRDYVVERLAEAAQLIRDEQASAVTIQIPAGGEITVRNLAQVQRVQKAMGGKLDVVRTYDFTAPRPDFAKFGIAPGESLIDAILNKINPKRKATKGTQAPEIGDMAAYRALYGDAARAKMNERLDTILAGTPNRLTPAQRTAIMQWASNEGLPMFDDALARSIEGARRVADFSMLNYAKRRNVDSFLSYLVPYHYWMTRSGLNWLERAMLKPQMASRFARVDRGINQDVENKDLPTRFQGTVPIPYTDIRVSNPLGYLLPYAQLYAREPFDDPVESENLLGKIYENSKAMGFGLLPVFDMLYLGTTGQKDRIRPFFWPDQLAYRIQEASGVQEPWTPETAIRKQFGLAPTDEWDPYRQAREVAGMAQRGEVSPRLASWAIDLITAKQRGEEPLPMTPEGLQPIVAEAQKSAAGKRLFSMMASYFGGIPAYQVDEAENTLRRANADRAGMKYGPDNPYGSMMGSNTLFDRYPGLGPWLDRSATIPGNEDWDRPGLKAAQSDMYDQRSAIYDQMNADVEAAYGANPKLTYDERTAIEAPYRGQVDALEAQYAQVPQPSPSAGNGRAPWEVEERAWEDLLAEYAYNYPGRPEYQKGQYQAYMTARTQWEQERAAALTAAAEGAGLGRFLADTDANTAIETYLDRIKGPNQLAAEGKGTAASSGAGGTGSTGGTGGTGGGAWTSKAPMSENVRELMGEYYTIDSWDDKRDFLLTTGKELAAYWKAKYGGGLMWWEIPKRSGAPSWWVGGGGRGGSSSGNSRPPQVYAREMDRGLWYRDQQRRGYQAPADPSAWLNAGAALRYRKMG